MRFSLPILISLLCLLPAMEVLAQQTSFSKRYEAADTADLAGCVLEVSGGYYVFSSFIYPGGRRDVSIRFIDSLGSTIWVKRYGAEGFRHYLGGRGGAIPTTDGGFATGGSVFDSLGNYHATLWKFNQDGDSLWVKKYGDSSIFQVGMQCKQTLDGGFVLVGVNEAFDTDGDFWLIKTDSLGNLEWDATYGGGGYEYGLSVDVCDDTGYILTGTTRSYGPGIGQNFSNIYIVKTDSLGVVQWTRVFGGIYAECVWNVEQTSDGGYVVGGCLTDSTIGGSSFSQPYIIKLDSAGNTEWDKTYGPVRYSTAAFMVHELTDGGFIVTGQTTDSLTENQIGFVLKVSATGDSLWYRTHVFSFSDGFSFNILYDIKQTSDNGFIACGWTDGPLGYEQEVWVLKLDSLGCMQPTANFAYAVQNDTIVFTNLSDPEMYTWSFGDGGVLTAYNDQPGTSPSHVYSDTGTYIVTLTVTSPACGNTDTFTDTVRVCPDATADFTYTNNGYDVGFTNQSEYAYDYVWYYGDGDSSIGLQPTHTYADTGYYEVTLISSGCSGLVSFTDTVYVPPFTGIEEELHPVWNLKIYPNPSSGSATVQLNQALSHSGRQLAIFDITGREVRTYSLLNGENEIRVHSNEIGKGMFFVRLLVDGETVTTQKMMITQ